MRTIWIIIPRIGWMDGLLESFSSPCALCAREGFTVRACFDSFLFSPSSSPPRFVVAPQPPRFSLLAFFPFDMFHSLPSYSCSKGYSLNLNVFFFPSSLGGRDAGCSPRFNDYAAFWCGSNDARTDEYLIWYWMWILEGTMESGKWKFREWIQLWLIRV